MGPAQISRDNTKRRIVIGVNVRDRDLQSVVTDIQGRISSTINLPVGYSITYGGQFENLQSAKDRLLIAVPVALVLIFILLYFAFNSVKEALIVYSAIPLSAVGGVLLLWIRDLPFSISAGVGFIALFGIAVLNGIVLIEHFKELKSQGITDIETRIKQGTIERLRPVLLTAAAAALGFLPMAISTNAGAEIQRPLATVVIGGLLTATILTLVVLPVLYAWMEEKKTLKMKKNTFTTLIIILISWSGFSQQAPLTVNETFDLALTNNAQLKASRLQVDEAEARISSAFHFDKTHIFYTYDENNLAVNNEPLKIYGISQDFLFPTKYFAEKRLNQAARNLKISENSVEILKLKRDVYANYYALSYSKNKAETYKYLDSLYSKFAKNAKRRFELGETNYLEMLTAESKEKQMHTLYNQANQEVISKTVQLNKIVQIDSLETINEPLEKLKLTTLSVPFDNPGLQYFEESKTYYNALVKTEKQALLPDISAEYFIGTNSTLNSNIQGYQIGLKIPLFFSGNAAKIKASKIAATVVNMQQTDYKLKLKGEYQRLLAQLQLHQEAVTYYELQGKNLQEEILKTASRSFQEGEIDFFQYIQSIETAKDMELEYLSNLNRYNQTIITLNHLIL